MLKIFTSTLLCCFAILFQIENDVHAAEFEVLEQNVLFDESYDLLPGEKK